MSKLSRTVLTLALVVANCAVYADQQGSAKPDVIAKAELAGMPTTATQEVRVLTATLQPGQRSVYHTHRSPVTCYVLEGALTLETRDDGAIVYPAGEVFFEKPDVPVTAYNASTSEPAKVVIFYVSDPETPFLDPISQ